MVTTVSSGSDPRFAGIPRTSSNMLGVGASANNGDALADTVRFRISIGGSFVQVSAPAHCRSSTVHAWHPQREALPLRSLPCLGLLRRPGVLISSHACPAVQKDTGAWKYVGGETFLESAPSSWRYADLVFSLAEKVDGAVSIKYQVPGEDTDPDALITVADDSDIQVRPRQPVRKPHRNCRVVCYPRCAAQHQF